MKLPVARKLAVRHTKFDGFKFKLFQNACVVYKHAYLNTCTLLFLHSTFMLCMVKMPLKREVGGRALNSHRNYVFNHGEIMEFFLDFLWEP